MGELVDRDTEHLHLLKLSYYITAGAVGFFSLFGLLYAALGIFTATANFPVHPNQLPPRFFGWFLAAVGIGAFLFGEAVAILTYWAGHSIALRRRRVFCLVIAGLICLKIPYGTAIGVCTFIVLSRPSVRALFEPEPAPAPGVQ